MSHLARYSLRWDWGPDGIDVTEVVDGPEGLCLAGRRGAVSYEVQTDASGATRTARVARPGDAAGEGLVLTRTADGWRDAAGARLAGADRALDVDIGCTAATNTLPIRRLRLAIGESAMIDAVLIPVPEGAPRVVRQRYSRNTDGYLYENTDSGFSAQLSVGGGGWVSAYPGLCRRMEAA